MALSAALALAISGCGSLKPRGAEEAQQARERGAAQRLKAVCSSPATYDRLKQVAFDEAIRIRNADPVNLDRLQSFAFVRVENPVVKSRDEQLDVTVCSGRFILTVPPGAERAFDGKRQLTADIEYAAQAAADGSGLVYRIKGAEPIIYRLAAFDLKAQSYRPTAVASADTAPPPPSPAAPTTGAPREVRPAAAVAPGTTGRPTRSGTTPPVRPPAQRAEAEPAYASPSFNCRRARSRSEKMVCASAGLAALDRTMSSRFYVALDNGDPRVRAELRRSRDRFLAYRERCPDEACVRQAYIERMEEIADIAGR